MTREEEKLLIAKIKSGDNDLYRELVEKHAANVLNLVRGVVSNREDAEEIAQDVFVKAYFSIKNFRGECSFSTWLYRIAYNMSVSKIRQRKINHLPLDFNKCGIASEESSFSERNDEREIQFSMLQKALFQLDPKDKFLVLSFYMYEKSIKELTVITGLSESNVKVRLHRSKKRLNHLINSNREVIYG